MQKSAIEYHPIQHALCKTSTEQSSADQYDDCILSPWIIEICLQLCLDSGLPKASRDWNAASPNFWCTNSDEPIMSFIHSLEKNKDAFILVERNLGINMVILIKRDPENPRELMKRDIKTKATLETAPTRTHFNKAGEGYLCK